MIADLEEFVVIDKRIGTHEEEAADSLRESLRARWDFGRLMLSQRKGKQLPKGMLTELIAATGKGRSELQYRMQFAERYPTEAEMSTALDTLKSWTQVKNSLPKTERKPKPKPVAEPQHQEAAVEQGAFDWDSLPPKAKERDAVHRKMVRRELEREFEPRVQAEVRKRCENVIKRHEEAQRRVKQLEDAQRGIFTKAEYGWILRSVHPDNSASVETRNKAFDLVKKMKDVLVKPEPKPLPPWMDVTLTPDSKRTRR